MNTNFNTNTNATIHVAIDTCFTFPVNAFNNTYDTTPKAIPSAIE